MNSLRNSVTLIGNLGQNPETRKFENGKVLSRIRIATNEVYTNNGGDKVTNTTWHTCVGWGKTAELMESLLKKGTGVALKGKLAYRDYEDKEGVKKTAPEIVISEFVLLEKKQA